MGNNRSSKLRQEKILDRLQINGRVEVNELSLELGVSSVTIRRDLDDLSDRGLIDRVHGGAAFKGPLRCEASLKDKRPAFSDEKRAIGSLAASLIGEGSTVFCNSGSTTLEVIRHISGKHVRIITNNVAACLLPPNPFVELFLVGGEFREPSNSLVGDMALGSIREIFSSCTILGTNSISTRFGLTTSAQQEAGINRLMVEQCGGPVIVVADSSKIGEASSFHSLPITKISTLITDSGVSQEAIQELESLGITVLIAPLDPPKSHP